MKVSRATFDQLHLCCLHLLNAAMVATVHVLNGPIAATLLISSVVAILTYVGLLRHNLRLPDTWPSLLDLWLFASTLRVGVGGLFTSMRLLTGIGEAPRLGPIQVTPYLLTGQALLLAGDAFLIAGYVIVQRRSRRQSEGRLREQKGPSPALMAILLFVVTVLFRFATSRSSLVGSVGNLGGLVEQFGMAAALFLALVAWTQWNKQRESLGTRVFWWLLVALCLSLEIAWQLQSYMRQGVLIALIPLGAFAWWRWQGGFWKGRSIVMGAVGVLTITMVLLWPYADLRRPDAWIGQQRMDVRELPVLPYLRRSIEAAIPGTDQWNEVHRFPDRGFWAFFNRAQVTTPAALAAYLQKNRPEEGRLLFEGAVTNLIPRIAWPEKPPYAPGRIITVAIGQATSAASATTATALTLQGGSAWAVGPWLGLPLLGLTGAALALLWGFWRPRLLSNPVAAFAALGLWTEGIRVMESTVDLGITMVLYSGLVFIPLALAWEVLVSTGRTFRRVPVFARYG